MEEDRAVRQKLSDVPFHIDPSVISSIADAVSRIQNSLKTNYASATDAAFASRLEKALQKNLDYVEKKDARAAQMLANGKTEHFKNIPPPPVFTGKMPSRLGIGSSTLASVPTTSASASATTVVASSQQHHNNSHAQEACSVYVSNLPTDITEEELEILFGPVGRIKKVKIYTTALGKQKGDALVTFLQADSAATACIKFNGLDIGDGHVLSITRAEFGTAGGGSGKTAADGTSSTKAAAGAGVSFVSAATAYSGFIGSTSTSTSTSSSIATGSATTTSNSIAPQSIPTAVANIVANGNSSCHADPTAVPRVLYELLPAETEAGRYPVALVLNAFDPSVVISDDSDYFDELESDMLLECCKFGKVRTIQLLTLTPAYMATLSTVLSHPHNQQGHAAPMVSTAGMKAGTIAVTFEAVQGALECASALSGRRFDGRQLHVYVLVPQAPATVQAVGASHGVSTAEIGARIDNSNISFGSIGVVNGSGTQRTNVVPPPPPPPRMPKPAVSVGVSGSIVQQEVKAVSAPDLQAIANDVDDFLSSLL